MAKKKTSKKTELSYGEAVGEIETILTALEDNENVDIDQLADQVELASGHIQLCFSKLKAAESRVEKITAELDKATAVKGSKSTSSKSSAVSNAPALSKTSEGKVSEGKASEDLADQFVEDVDFDAPF